MRIHNGGVCVLQKVIRDEHVYIRREKLIRNQRMHQFSTCTSIQQFINIKEP